MATKRTSAGIRNCRVCRAHCEPTRVNGIPDNGSGRIVIMGAKAIAFCGDCWLQLQAAVAEGVN